MLEGVTAADRRTRTVLSTDPDPRDALTALVAVAARRANTETVPVAGDVTAELDLSADPTFAELSAEVRALVGEYFAVHVGGVDLVATAGGTQLGSDAVDDLDDLAGQLGCAIADGRREPSPRISVLDLASDADRALVATFEGGDPPPAQAHLIHELVREQARLSPDAPALTAAGETLSYRQFVDRADRLAQRLVHAGVRGDQAVGVLGERSPELIIALLAVLEAGGAYLALTPEWPDARLAGLLRDAAVQVVVTSSELACRVPDGITVVSFDGEPDGGADLPVGLTPDNLAYVSYTSGSTGEPKGVCVPHAAVSRLVHTPDWADFDPKDVFLQAAPASFDASTLEIWAPLCNGGRLALLPAGRLDPQQLGEVVQAEGVTVLWLTAGLFQQMVDHHIDRLAGVRHLVAGGDVVSPATVRRLLDAHPHLIFTNGYGPTENTTFTTCATFRDTIPDGPVPIGRPIRGTRVRVLDAAGKPVPPGIVGELHAAGAGLARGYLGRPGATAELFTPAEAGQRSYRTGDLARWRTDGSLDFLGRADDQVKINGYRVEPNELVTAITAYPEVRAAAVITESGPGTGVRLAAYVVPSDSAADTDLLVQNLRGWLREKLPDYLVPARVMALTELPLTRNGKVDRAALPVEHKSERIAPTDYAAPRGPLERFLCELWAEALKVDLVGIDDDFFELGGHSLIAADLLGRLQQDFGVELPARKFYLSPTIGELSELDELSPLRAHIE